MSSMSSSSAQDISDLQSGIVMGYVSIACAVFPIYDYILTTGTEVTVFWSQPQKTFRGSSLLLILIRLTTLGTAITNVISMFFGSANVEICRGLYLSAAIVTDLGNALDAVLSTIRVFALSGLNVWWASVVFVTSMFIVTIKFYLNAKTQYTVQNIDGIVMCNIFTYSGSVAANHFTYLVQLAALICNIISQVIVACITWTRMMFLVRRNGDRIRPLRQKTHIISWLILRDGTIYFILMLLLTVTAFLLSYFTDVLYFDTFSQSFQMVLLARLLLNLREGALKHVIMDEENSGFSHFLDDLTHVSSIEFNPDPTDNTPRLGLHQPTTEDETGDEPSDVDEVADGHGIEAHELREISVARV